ncbi:MAG: hypothetical protein ACKVPX_05775 [Myxococcaceae bacterium]
MKHFRKRASALGFAAALCLMGGPGLADPYDVELHRLGNPTPGGAAHAPDANANFRVLMRQLASAFTLATLAPPGTLGHNGFFVGLELGVVHLNTDSFLFPTRGAFRAPLLVPSLRIRKGLPLSFEVGARLTWMEKSATTGASFDVKWAFGDGLSALPDAAIRGHITRLFNTRDFSLTTGGIDLGLGKSFAVGGALTLTPYGGYDLNWVNASSNVVDFNPARDPQTEADTVPERLEDTATFQAVRPGANIHHRAYLGLRLGVGVLQLTVEGAVVAFSGIQAPSPDDPGTLIDRSLPAVLALNSSLALAF